MTYEEAIKHIGLNANKFWTTVEDLAALQKAIEALEKQMPKKPAKQWGDNVCPNCRTDTRCRVLMGWEKHCPDCGQAIDWSDDE